MSKNPPSSWIVETNDANFDREVIERSRDVPVVVDFWAEWCGPCRMLGPVLEELADEYAGRFVLAKADTEQTPNAARQFNVSSIPAVFGIVKGEPVEGFLGVQGQDQLRLWLDRLIAKGDLAKAADLETTDPAAAETAYRRLAELAPNDATATIGLARVLLSQDREDECRELLDKLASRGFLEPEAEKLKSQLEFRRLGGVDVDSARAASAASPDDLSLQLELAEVLVAHQQYGEAFDLALDLVARDRQGIGESARQMMVDAFRLLPEDSELLKEYRRRLSMALY